MYAGPHAIPGAVESLRSWLESVGVRLGYVTNNASRTPAQVAAHLRELGAPAEDNQVVSSSQAAGELLAGLLAPGSRVMITGSPALAHEIELVGLTPVHSAKENPVAVVQGFNPEIALEGPGRGVVRRCRQAPSGWPQTRTCPFPRHAGLPRATAPSWQPLRRPPANSRGSLASRRPRSSIPRHDG